MRLFSNFAFIILQPTFDASYKDTKKYFSIDNFNEFFTTVKQLHVVKYHKVAFGTRAMF